MTKFLGHRSLRYEKLLNDEDAFAVHHKATLRTNVGLLQFHPLPNLIAAFGAKKQKQINKYSIYRNARRLFCVERKGHVGGGKSRMPCATMFACVCKCTVSVRVFVCVHVPACACVRVCVCEAHVCVCFDRIVSTLRSKGQDIASSPFAADFPARLMAWGVKMGQDEGGRPVNDGYGESPPQVA